MRLEEAKNYIILAFIYILRRGILLYYDNIVVLTNLFSNFSNAQFPHPWRPEL